MNQIEAPFAEKRLLDGGLPAPWSAAAGSECPALGRLKFCNRRSKVPPSPGQCLERTERPRRQHGRRGSATSEREAATEQRRASAAAGALPAGRARVDW